MSKDIIDAIQYVDAHEIVGLLEMLKISVATQVLQSSAKEITDELIGDEVVN